MTIYDTGIFTSCYFCNQDSQGYRRPAKQPVARPDESVRQPDVHSGGDGNKQDVVWGGVDIKKQVYTPAKCTNLLVYINLL
jgi:hypothetical protein